jgi:hypothetical protein
LKTIYGSTYSLNDRALGKKSHWVESACQLQKRLGLNGSSLLITNGDVLFCFLYLLR